MGGEEKMNWPLGFLVCLRLFIGVFCIWWHELKLAICLLCFAINSSFPCLNKSPCHQQTFSLCFAQFTYRHAKWLSCSGRLQGMLSVRRLLRMLGDTDRRRWCGNVQWPKEWDWNSCSISLAPGVNPREPGDGFLRWAYPGASQQDPSGSPAPFLGEERDPSRVGRGEYRHTESLCCFPSSCCDIPWTNQSTLPIRENHLFRKRSITCHLK